MINLKFEIKKILRGKKILIAIILSILISSVIFASNYINQYKIPNRIIDEYYPWYEKLVSENKIFMGKKEENNISDKDMEEYLRPNERLQKALLEFFEIVETGKMEEIPDKILYLYDEYGEYSKEHIVKTKPTIKMLQISETRLNSDREYFENISKRNLPYEDDEYSITGSNFVKSIVDKVYGLPLAILLILLCVDIFTRENVDGTERIRKTQPVKRANILFGKIIAAFIYMTIFIVSMLLSSYLIAGIFGNGFGSLLYPVQRGPMLLAASKDSVILFELMATSKYILFSTVYFAVYMLFVLSVVLLIATLFKQTLIVSTVSVVLISLASVLSKKHIEVGQWVDGIRPSYPVLNPLAYEFTDKIIQDLSLKSIIIVLIPICFSFLLVYFSHALTKITFVQNLFTRKNIKDGEKSLQDYENSKIQNKFVNFRFEILKIWKKREIYMVALIIFTLTFVYFYNSNQKYNEVFLGREDFYGWKIERTQESLDYFTEGIMHDRLKKDYEKYVGFEKAYIENDKEKIAGSMIDVIIENKERATGFMGYPGEGFALETIKINISEINEIKLRNVDVSLPKAYEVRSTPFDKFRTISDYIKYMNYSERYQPSVTYTINGIFKDNLNYLFLLIIAIAFGIGFADEKEEKNTLRLMNIQPVKGSKIYLAKFSARAIVFISLIILAIGISSTGLLLSGEKIEKNYPAIYYENETQDNIETEKLLRNNLSSNEDNEPVKMGDKDQFVYYRFRDMGIENLEIFINFLAIGIMIIAISMIVSLEIKNRWQISLLTLFIFGLGYGISIKGLKGYSFLLPFIWINQGFVTSGEANITFNTSFLSGQIGLISMALWLIVISFVGIKKYNKKLGRD